MNRRLEPLTADLLPGLTDLRLAPGQDRFVAPVLDSIAQAYVTPTAWPRAIIETSEDGADRVVGFVMANFDPDNEVAAFRCGIWRLQVDSAEQGRGVGRFAVEQVAAEARRRGQSHITVLWVPGDEGPERFYLGCGFQPTGETLFDQTIGIRPTGAVAHDRTVVIPRPGRPESAG